MPAPVSTVKASGVDRLGQNSAMAGGHLRTPQESQEWQHGWQCLGVFHFSHALQEDNHAVSPFRRVSVTLSSQRRRCPGFRSDSSGVCHSHALVPVLLLERLQLPLPVDEAVCSGCHAPLDLLGRQSFMRPHWQTQESCTPIERILV